MKALVKPKWSLDDADRAHLCALAAAVDPGAPEDDPALILLLNYWEGLGPPWDLRPFLGAARCRPGEDSPHGWFVYSTAAVLAAIGRHLEES